MGESLRQGRGRVHQPVRSGERDCTLSLAPVRALAPVKGPVGRFKGVALAWA